jgi:hypothetical protein
MKTLLVQLILIFTFISCSEVEQKSAVEIYIQQVKESKYIADALPKFSSNDIPVILNSANDFTIISKFPINPLSSYGPTKFTVGECLLWTVENIRLHYGNYSGSNYFPSFVPELHIKNDVNSNSLNNSQLIEVYNLYFNWWYDNKGKDFSSFREKSPLSNSSYSWK